MPHSRIYGRHGETYIYPVRFHELSHARIQELLYDDSQVDVTPSTWLTQTAGFIARLKETCGDSGNTAISIEPTMDPEYALKVTVQYTDACSIQNKIDSYLLNLPADLRID